MAPHFALAALLASAGSTDIRPGSMLGSFKPPSARSGAPRVGSSQVRGVGQGVTWQSLFVRPREPPQPPWERFASTWESKWGAISHGHVLQESIAASTLQVLGEVGAQLILGYDVNSLDWERIATRASAAGLWYAVWMSRYVHAIDAVEEVAPDAMGEGAGTKGEMLSVGVRTAIDNFVSTPLLYFPFFHVFTGMLLEHSTLTQCLQTYQSVWLQENESSAMMYIPAQIANFAVVPQKYRAPFLFSVDFCWAIVWALLLTPHPDAVDAASAAAETVSAIAAASGA